MERKIFKTLFVSVTLLTIANCAPFTEIRFNRVDGVNVNDSKPDLSIMCTPDQANINGKSSVIKRITVVAKSTKHIEDIVIQKVRIVVERNKLVDTTLENTKNKRFTMTTIKESGKSFHYGYLNIPVNIDFVLSNGSLNFVSFFFNANVRFTDNTEIDTNITNRYIGKIEKGWYPILTH